MLFGDLPPLAFLPTLEAAGRLGSFKAAAEELHVTPSAVSQQVKAIEEALGIELFERRRRTVVLTEDGERYLSDVRATLRVLVEAGRRLRRVDQPSVMRLDTVPFVAHEFLLPRLSKLRARFPTLELSLDTNMRVRDLQTTEVDAAIRMGAGPWPGIVTRPFGSIELALVCSPELARDIHELSDVSRHTILEIRGLKEQERGMVNGLKAHGVHIEPRQVVSFESYYETVRAAEHGAGVAMGLFPLTTEWVLSGRLAVPLNMRSTLPGYIALVHRHGDERRFPYEPFTAWLQEEYDALRPLPPGRLLLGASTSATSRPSAPRAARSQK